MASRFALGFLGGAAKYGADFLEQRQKDDAEIRKEKMLAELRAAQAKDQAVFEDKLRSAHTNVELSGPDYTTGKFVFRDAEGNVKSERDLTQAEKDAYAMEKRKGDLSLENISSEIASRAHDDALADKNYGLNAMQTAASVEASRASAAYSRASAAHLGSLDGTENSKVGMGNRLDARANELLYQNKDIKNGLIAAGIPAENVTQLAQDVVAQAAALQAQGKQVSVTSMFTVAAQKMRDLAKSDAKRKGGRSWSLDETDRPGSH